MLHEVDTDDSDDDTFEPEPSAVDLHPHGGGRRYLPRSEKHGHNSSHYRRHYRKHQQHLQQQPPRARSASLPQETQLSPPGDINRNTPSIPSIYVSPVGTQRKSEVLG